MKFGRKIYSSWRVQFEFIEVHSKMNDKAIQEGSRYFLCMFSCFETGIEILEILEICRNNPIFKYWSYTLFVDLQNGFGTWAPLFVDQYS